MKLLTVVLVLVLPGTVVAAPLVDGPASRSTLVCLESAVSDDTDKDGIPDCADEDDDNDRLADEVEDWLFPGRSAHLDRDLDRDGIIDALDLKPESSEGVILGFSLLHFASRGCDLDGRADPYFSSLWLDRVPGGTHILAVPPEWRADDARHRGASAIDHEEAVEVSAFIEDWPLQDWWLIPRIETRVLMYERDRFSFDDGIDLGPTYGMSSGSSVVVLGEDVRENTVLAGNHGCRGTLRMRLDTDVQPNHARMAVAAWSKLDGPVTREDIEHGPFR